MSNQKSQNTYVNLTATGLAFINRLRWVESRDPYLALSLNSWHGQDGKEQTLFEAIPKGDIVLSILQDLMDQYPQTMEGYRGDDKVTVTCGFVVGGLKPGFFSSKNGDVDCIRCNLIKIQWIKVNGEYFYREKDESEAANQGDNQDYTATPEPPRRRAQSNDRPQRQMQSNGYQNGSPQRQPAMQQRKGTQQRNGQQGQPRRSYGY